MGPAKSELERKQKEDQYGDGLNREQPLAVRVQFGARVEQERRTHEEQIRRPVGHNRPGQERNVNLPLEDKGRDAMAKAGYPSRQCISGKEERHQGYSPPRGRPSSGRPSKGRVACCGW